MYRELERCIGELSINHTDKEVTRVLSKYSELVRSVSEEYDDLATETDIRADHPDLAFMGTEQVEGVLEQASAIRRGPDAKERLTREDVIHLCCENCWFDEKEYDGAYARLLEVSKHGIHAKDLISIVWCSSGEDLGEIKKQVEGYLHGGREDEKEKVMQELLRQFVVWMASDKIKPLMIRYHDLIKGDI